MKGQFWQVNVLIFQVNVSKRMENRKSKSHAGSRSRHLLKAGCLKLDHRKRKGAQNRSGNSV
jgi:hypothetical protein